MNVIPQPQHIETSAGVLSLNASATITGAPAAWLLERLRTLGGILLSDGEPTVAFEIGEIAGDLPNTIGKRADGADPHSEAHRIEVSAEGVLVTGVSEEALFRGATTLLHLMVQTGGELPIGTIIDAPRFAWRGLSFDVVRCFHPVETVKEVIDLLALYKMNVLHLHLTDTEGWRFTVPQWPLLTEVSGKTARDGRPGGWYTPEEFAEIVQYAADRYITVVPEFDSPGHTASVLVAYPELASEEIRAMPDAMHYLHPDQPEVPNLLRDVYAAMAEATPGNYLHVGGDEAIAMDHETFQRYIQMALPIARDTGKSVVAWQEAARGGLAEGDVIQYWIPPFLIDGMKGIADGTIDPGPAFDSNDPVRKAFIELLKQADADIPAGVEQGADVLISPATWFYLDTKYVEPTSNPYQNELVERLGLPQMVYGQGTVEDSYSIDPRELVAEVDEDRIAGVECAIWCETITSRDDLFFQLLPRLAGVAENAWSAQQTWDQYRPRLAEQPVFWRAMSLPWFKAASVWSE